MPAKGWKKNAEGQYAPVMSEMPQKDNEPVSIDSVLLPKATVNRLAKSVLKSNEILSKEGLSVIQRSSTVFINYIHHYAREFSMDANRKTVNEDDILLAIQKCEFEGFLPTLRQELDLFKERKAAKKHGDEPEPQQEGEQQGEQQEGEQQEEQPQESEIQSETQSLQPESQPAESEEPETKRLKVDLSAVVEIPHSEITPDVENDSAQ